MRRIEKPLGLYILATADFLVIGVMPLLTFILAARNSETEVPVFQVLTSVVVYLCVMGAAVWAWSGDNAGRWVLLSTVTFIALQWIVHATLALAGSDIESGQKPRVIGFISRGLMALALNWWYFNRKSTVAYYKQAS